MSLCLPVRRSACEDAEASGLRYFCRIDRVRAGEPSPHCYLLDATRGLLATDHVISNHGQVTWTTPELAPPLLTTTPHQREDVSALDRFNVHRCSTRWVFSGTGLELVTWQATNRYLYHSATLSDPERSWRRSAGMGKNQEGIDHQKRP
ncbi:uncharacterized protein TNCV_4274631 [Trichonephila clavipes]|nr:uncharacterized protein TNCV_4274631 [Trichonephila clavipes]